MALIQISSVVGIWGITFIVMWFASVIIWILDNKFEWLSIKTGVLIYSFILLLILLYGGLRLGVFTPESKTVTIASFTATNEIEYYSKELERRGFHSSINMAKKNGHSNQSF